MEDWKKIEMRERDMAFLAGQSSTNPFMFLINILFDLGLTPFRLISLLLKLVWLPLKLILGLGSLIKR